MIQWAIELSQFDIEYRPRTAIKAQAPVDFIAKFTSPEHEDSSNEPTVGTIHTDGSSIQKRWGANVIITFPKGDTLKYGVQLNFPVTNNEAEYEAILTGLKIAQALGAKTALLKSNS